MKKYPFASANRLKVEGLKFSWLSLSRTHKGLETLFEIEGVRDIEIKIDYSLTQMDQDFSTR